MSNEFCQGYGFFYPAWLLITAASTDGLLLLRVLALTKRNPITAMVLRYLYIGSYSVLTGLLAYYFYAWAMRAPDFETNLGCVQTYYLTEPVQPLAPGDAVLSIATVPILLVNTTLLVAVLCAVLPYARGRRTITPLFGALIRDGVMYFAVILGVTVITTITPLVYYNVPRSNSLAEPWLLSINPMAASRLFLNLRSTMAQSTPDMPDGLPHPIDTEEGSYEMWSAAQ